VNVCYHGSPDNAPIAEIEFAIHPNNMLDDWDAFDSKEDEGFFSEPDQDEDEQEALLPQHDDWL
jgi:hypothetical protein